MRRSILVLVVASAVLVALFAWPKRLVVVDTRKVCQLTGDVDRERFEFHPERTRFGVTGSDLGYPVEHVGRLYFLFGDTRDTSPDLRDPNAHGFDAIATGPLEVADPDQCISLEFSMEADRTFQRIRLGELNRPARPLGRFETPISGFSHAGLIWAFFTVRDGSDRCAIAGWRKGCALGDDTPGGESLLAKSFDRGRNFEMVTTVSTSKFQWLAPAIVEASDIPELPADIFGPADQVLLMWGSGREETDRPARHSYAYLAVAKMTALGTRSLWVYYCARPGSEVPRWCESEEDAEPLFSAQSERYGGRDFHRCLGEFSVSRVRWGERGDTWVMMYACGATSRQDYDPGNVNHYNPANLRGIHLRTADQPWGPWSFPTRVFEPTQHGGYCRFIHAQDNPCFPNASDAGQRDQQNPNKRSWGGEYAPMIIPSYTKVAGDALTLYFAMSTWNPYQVVMMKTQIRAPRWYEVWFADPRALGGRF